MQSPVYEKNEPLFDNFIPFDMLLQDIRGTPWLSRIPVLLFQVDQLGKFLGLLSMEDGCSAGLFFNNQPIHTLFIKGFYLFP